MEINLDITKIDLDITNAGQVCHYIMTLKKMKPRQLSEKSGVGTNIIWRFQRNFEEKGNIEEKEKLTIAHLRLLAKALEIDITTFFPKTIEELLSKL